MKRLIYIDSLRGIASLIVALFWHYPHFSNLFQTNSVGLHPPFYWLFPARFFFEYGDVMVDLFFVLSGVVFSYTYLESIKALKVSGYSFFIKRFSRLYPIHFLTLIIVAVLAFLFHYVTGTFPIYQINDGYHFMLNILFIQKGFADQGYSFNAPSWSLSIEGLMYLIFYVQARYFNVIFTSIALVIIGLSIYRLPYDLAFLINHTVARGLMGFFSGCVSYRIFIEDNLYKKYRWTIILSYCITTVFYFTYFKYHFTIQSHLIMIFFAIIIIAEGHCNRNFRFLLENRFFKLLGDISLSIYLIHIPIQIIILLYFRITHLTIQYDSYLLFIVYTLSIITAGWLLHILVESPAQNWIRLNFINRSSN